MSSILSHLTSGIYHPLFELQKMRMNIFSGLVFWGKVHTCSQFYWSNYTQHQYWGVMGIPVPWKATCLLTYNTEGVPPDRTDI